MIIIVDDNHSMLRLLENLIKEKGFETKSFSAVDVAINWFKEGNRPSLIITDLHMPEKTGENLIKWLNINHINIPIIIITADQFYPKGIYPVLYKPFDTEMLYEFIHDSLERSD